MGAGESHDLVAPTQTYTNWERQHGDDLIKKYKGDPDMTFGIDEKACTRLLGETKSKQRLHKFIWWGEQHINALELLCAIAVFSKGDKEAIIKSLFSAFYFNYKNNISSAELIIMFISTLRAMICAIKNKAAGDDGPRDEDIEKLVDAKFKEDEDIPLSAFASFLEKEFFNKKGKGLGDVMNLSYALCQQFGIDSPAPAAPENVDESSAPNTESAPVEQAPQAEAQRKKVKHQRKKAKHQRKKAKHQRKKAKHQRKKAKHQRKKAKHQRKKVKHQRKKVKHQRKKVKHQGRR